MKLVTETVGLNPYYECCGRLQSITDRNGCLTWLHSATGLSRQSMSQHSSRTTLIDLQLSKNARISYAP